MRVLLSTYDSRGRVGPLVGLAVPTRELGVAVGEVNQQSLFGRVAAVVHHGGAGRGDGGRDAAATRPAEKGRQRGDLSKISLVARGGWPQSVSESPSP